jgi:hypothetical protein
MKKLYAFFSVTLIGVMLSCQEQAEIKNEIPNDVISQLQAAGYDTSEGLSKYKDGYLVEYDIFIAAKDLASLSKPVSVSDEHYRTFNLITGLPRTLLVYMDPGFDSYMQTSFDGALARYNAENLVLTFQRTTNSGSADIQILSFYENSNVLGYSAGFPTSSGDPASPIRLNTKYYNSTSQRADAKTVIAHEIGHAIGYRHTDYMSRRFSCGSGGNEGQSSTGVGAVYIPGTPTKGEKGSWMLACSDGTDRPFTAGDKTALSVVY